MKILRHTLKHLPDDSKFEAEIHNLSKARHKNIVPFVGYCYETEEVHVEYQGRIVVAEQIYSALCFEYMQNGSLQKFMYGMALQLETLIFLKLK